MCIRDRLYLTNALWKDHGMSLEGKTAAVSGSGNVAIYAIEKAQELGVKVVTCLLYTSRDDGKISQEEYYEATKEEIALNRPKKSDTEKINSSIDTYTSVSYTHLRMILWEIRREFP